MRASKKRFTESLHECWILEARIRNRDPHPTHLLEKTNEALRIRITELETALFNVLKAEGVCLEKDDERVRLETVKRHSLEFLKTLKVDPKLWQDLASS